MATDYNTIAREYQASKLQPWRKHVEAHSFFELIGDLSGKTVLDLACGDGFYTRLLKLRGASSVEGVDISAEMIRLAQEAETKNPLGISYHEKDVLGLSLGRKFDLITASYLLNYAKSPEELLQFAKAIALHLKPGGRFVTINSNPDYRCPMKTMSKYGFTRENKDDSEGGEVIYRFYQSDENHITIINYHLEKDTHVQMLNEAGLSDVKWHPMVLSPEGEKEYGADFWKAILRCQPVVGLTGAKF